MEEVIYISPDFKDPDDFRQWEIDNEPYIFSPSRLGCLSACPRKYQHRYVDKYTSKVKGPMLAAGSLMHTGIHWWYMTNNVDDAIEAMRSMVTEPEHYQPRDEHLTLPHLEIVLRNYADHWMKHGTYQPVLVNYNDVIQDNLIAAKWMVTDHGMLVLGESMMIVRIEDPDSDRYIYVKMVPDMPVTNRSGNHYIMDHKTTSGYLSDYWAMKYRIADQFRLYAEGMHLLTGVPYQGAVLDAVYVGKYATIATSKATKFDRREWGYDASMIKESVRNAIQWQEIAGVYHETKYYPQNTGLYCGNCEFMPDFCQNPDWARELGADLIEKTEIRSLLDPRM